MEDFFRYVSGNSELRGCKAFVMFLMPDDEFGSFTDNGSEVVSCMITIATSGRGKVKG